MPKYASSIVISKITDFRQNSVKNVSKSVLGLEIDIWTKTPKNAFYEEKFDIFVIFELKQRDYPGFFESDSNILQRGHKSAADVPSIFEAVRKCSIWPRNTTLHRPLLVFFRQTNHKKRRLSVTPMIAKTQKKACFPSELGSGSLTGI